MKSCHGTSRRFLRLPKALIIFAFCVTHFALEVKTAPVIRKTEIVQYLSQFGYLSPVDPGRKDTISEETLTRAISDFQSSVGINVNGNIDAETAYMMTLSRCGVKDKVTSSTNRRSKRWAGFRSKWSTTNVTYKISKYSTSLGRKEVDQEIAKAFAVWSEQTDLIFTKQEGKVDIEISFAVGDHGDNRPFDGPSLSRKLNELAHAFAPGPQIGGDVHFDDTERWTIESSDGFNLFYVAAHEIGHSLGLDHSSVKNALMAPYYKEYDPYFMLHEDDIMGIQALYPRKMRHENIDICKDPKIDTIFNSVEGQVYIFKGDHYWTPMTIDISDGYSKLIAEGWKGLPSSIDAAFTHDGQTYFFKGAEYWIYKGRRMAGRNPRKIGNDFPGIPNDIGAATVSGSDGLIYFFKGDKFWKFNPAQRLQHERSYPKPISSWPGLPDNVDAAFSYGGDTFFFKGDAHYRFNERTFSMDPASPYETGSSLFGCQSESNEVLEPFSS